jgi:hypothetical protein
MRLAMATGMTCCLGFIAFTESRPADTPAEPLRATLADNAALANRDVLADRDLLAEEQRASRSRNRTPPPATPTATPSSPKPKAVATKAPVKAPVKPKPTRPARPQPVAGLDQAQMDNAAVIVQVGVKLGIPRRGLIVAIATAMQESNLYNLANQALPESLNYPNQGTGFDYDSVGLFQQRTSSGWGTVADLMRPAYAAQAFFEALVQIPDWQQLSVSGAAQAVQGSAFPDAYAQHEEQATTVVDALV